MTKTLHKNKLVRDLIPQIIKARGAAFSTRTLEEREYKTELRKKLLEEAKEVLEDDANLLDELADVLELVKSIGATYKFSYKDIEKRQLEKNKTNGGFKDKIFLEWVEEN